MAGATQHAMLRRKPRRHDGKGLCSFAKSFDTPSTGDDAQWQPRCSTSLRQAVRQSADGLARIILLAVERQLTSFLCRSGWMTSGALSPGLASSPGAGGMSGNEYDADDMQLDGGVLFT